MQRSGIPTALYVLGHIVFERLHLNINLTFILLQGTPQNT